jgi:hypothetical protein
MGALGEGKKLKHQKKVGQVKCAVDQHIKVIIKRLRNDIDLPFTAGRVTQQLIHV